MRDIRHFIADTRSFLELCWELIEKCNNIGNSDNTPFVASMLYVSFNHADAVQLLAQNGNFPSAYALMRPLIETSIRAIWLHDCATDDQIKKCIEKDDWKGVYQLIDHIESSNNFSPVLSKMWESLKNDLHSFCHGGTQNAFRQMGKQNLITPNIPDSEIIQILTITILIAHLLTIYMVRLTKNENLLVELTKLDRNLPDWFLNGGL